MSNNNKLRELADSKVMFILLEAQQNKILKENLWCTTVVTESRGFRSQCMYLFSNGI